MYCLIHNRSMLGIPGLNRANSMRMIRRIAAAFSVLIILAAGCATQTKIVKLYDDPVRGVAAYKRLLIVDVSNDSNQRQNFENQIAAKLRRVQVDAIPSHTVLDAGNVIRQDDINRASDDVEADGILITHIASVDTTVSLEEGRDELKFDCRGGDPVDYFLYDHEVISEPDSGRVAHTVVVITNLYGATTHKRVWTIQSTCFNKASMSDVLLDEADAIVRQLKTDKLI